MTVKVGGFPRGSNRANVLEGRETTHSTQFSENKEDLN